MRNSVVPFALLFAAVLHAQPAAFRLNFSFHEIENGKRLNARNYSMTIEPNVNGSLRIGSKVAVASNPGPTTQYSYIDVGVNVKARLQEQGPELRLHAEIEVSNLGADREAPNRPLPQIRQIRADVDTILTPGRAIPLATLDDPAAPRQYEIELTATRVK